MAYYPAYMLLRCDGPRASMVDAASVESTKSCLLQVIANVFDFSYLERQTVTLPIAEAHSIKKPRPVNIFEI